MYHLVLPCGSHDFLLSGLTWATTLVPGGANGVQLKSKVPCSCPYADRWGLSRDVRSRFKVMLAWGTRVSQRYNGKFGSVVQCPATKWFFQVQIARSAALRQCMPGGTSWKSTSCSSMKSFKTLLASLSRRWSCGHSPHLTRSVWMLL